MSAERQCELGRGAVVIIVLEIEDVDDGASLIDRRWKIERVAGVCRPTTEEEITH
jgi:hypothetical protein